MTRRLLALAVMATVPALALAGPFGTNFESYSIGPVAGQDNWVEDNYGPGALAPEIVADPTGGGHGQVLKIDYAGVDANWSGAFRPTGNLVAEGATSITMSWDQWRPALHDNVWIAEDISYSGWWGIQWDQSGKQHLKSFDEPAGVLNAGVWQNVKLVFNVPAASVEGFINNVSFGTATGINLAQFRGIDIEVSGTEAGGGAAGPCYFDNIVVTPEPATLALLALGMLIRRR